MNARAREHGFTLVELVATMIVLGVAAAMAAPLALELSRASTTAQRTELRLSDASHALGVIGDLLRAAPELETTTPGESGLESISESRVNFSDGREILFEAGAVFLVEDGVRRMLCVGVDQLIFRGYEADGETVAEDAADIRRVECELATGTTRLASVTALRVGGSILTLTWTVDNIGEIYVDGVLVDSDSTWRQARTVSVPVSEGEHVIAIHARDTGGPGAAIVDMRIGEARSGTGVGWRVATAAPGGWEEPGFDDSDWDLATPHGVHGVSPWGLIDGFPLDSLAMWLWTSDAGGDNEVYLRGRFGVLGGSFVVSSGGTINFNEQPVLSFGGFQDGQYGIAPEHEALDGGSTLRLGGNAWKAVALPYEVTENTVIEFEFRATLAAEIQGVMLGTDLDLDASRGIQVNGPQDWARHRAPDVPAYTGDGEWQSYSIRVGDLPDRFPLGQVSYLVLINDDDNREHDDGALGESFYRNVRVYEAP